MKIASIRTYEVPPRWPFLKVITDSGICVWSQPMVEVRARDGHDGRNRDGAVAAW